MESAHDINTRQVLACDESFFTALLAADHDLLGTILADDFVITDVLSGQVDLRAGLYGWTWGCGYDHLLSVRGGQRGCG